MLVQAPFNDITREIIGSAIDVHRARGPGLLESAYLPCLQFELSARHLRWAAQRVVPITYKGLTLDTSYRVDLIVEDLVVVELKSVERLLNVHDAQGLTYLKLTGCPAGLLINFNVAKLTDGVRRLLRPGTNPPVRPAFGRQMDSVTVRLTSRPGQECRLVIGPSRYPSRAKRTHRRVLVGS